MNKQHKTLLATAIFCCVSACNVIAAGTISIPSTSSFQNDVANLNTCFMTRQTNCNGQDVSDLFISDNPQEHWSSINQAISNSSANGSSQNLPALPNNISFSAPAEQYTPATTPQQQTTTQTTASTPTGIITANDSAASSSGFVVG